MVSYKGFYVELRRRQYLHHGQSWAQIREMDLATGRRIQLTTSARHHWKPWCSPDNKSILFTTGSPDKALYRFDRVTKRETPVMTLEQDFFAVSAALSNSRVVIQEYGGIIEIIDIAAARRIRRFSGINPVVSSDRKLLAWETRRDPFSKVHPHILFSGATQRKTHYATPYSGTSELYHCARTYPTYPSSGFRSFARFLK